MNTNQRVHPIPFNVGEAVIEPFWASGFHTFAQWRVTCTPGTAARVQEQWSNVGFEWARAPASGPVFSLHRELTVDCADYDALTLSCVLPPQTHLVLIASTDAGDRRTATPAGDGTPREFALALEGARTLTRLEIECHTLTPEPMQGCFYWIGLENAAGLAAHLHRWELQRNIHWERYLAPVEDPSFTPAYGIFLDPAQLDTLRARHAQYVQACGTSPFLEIRDEILNGPAPESQIREFVGAEWELLTRERDKRKYYQLVRKARNAATAGIILKDRLLMEAAVKYAVSIAICDKWGASHVNDLPGCEFESRVFYIGECMEDIAITLDLAGEFISWHGREYLQRRIADYGMGAVNYTVWRWDYIHQCNQMPAFSRSRLYACLVLERAWERVRPYTDLALEEMGQSLAHIIHADGGFSEGPHYLQYALQTSLPACYYFARARNLPFASVLPGAVHATARYVEAFTSTDDAQEFIPHNDGGWDSRFTNEEAVVFLAAMLPESHWVTAWRKFRQRRPKRSKLIYAWEIEDAIPAHGPAFTPRVVLDSVGIAASLRHAGAEPVKLMIIGATASNAGGHQHADIGSFVLEFAGDTFAMDSGTCRYDNVHADLFARHDRHNVLVPAGTEERPVMTKRVQGRFVPELTSDTTRLHARINLDTAWPGYFTALTREWISETPEALHIRDTYTLAKGTGADWQWLTLLDVAVTARNVVVSGRRGRAVITIPEGCTVHVDRLSMPDERVQRRITFHREGRQGIIDVPIRLEQKENT